MFLFWLTSLFFFAIVSSEARASVFVPDAPQSLSVVIEKTATGPSYIATTHIDFQLKHLAVAAFLPTRLFSLEAPKSFRFFEAAILRAKSPKCYAIRTGLSPPMASA
ncbi:MAG: hypothetical protein ACXWRE_09080 [Pseudobdellovibrionaceae bacterium]